jgi:hypothetical protein
MEGYMNRRSQDGLSLMEILISICIIVVVFFTTYQIFITGIRFYKSNQRSTILMKLAQERLEIFVADRKPQGPDAGSYDGVMGTWTRFDAPNNDCQWRVGVLKIHYNYPPSIPPYPDYDIYNVTLEAWGPVNPDSSKSPVTKTITLTTTVAPVVPDYPGKCSHDENRRDEGPDFTKSPGGTP